METNQIVHIQAPIGNLEVWVSPAGVKFIQLLPPGETPGEDSVLDGNSSAGEVSRQLKAYMRGELKTFSLALDWKGVGEFQRRVLEVCGTIPWGKTRTYGQLAEAIGNPKAARAVGTALSKNPFMLIVPCHRVVGGDRKMHGFASPFGIQTKEWLLEHEGEQVKDGRLVSRKE